MADRSSSAMRASYLAALIEGLGITWPILSGLLIFKAGLGVIVGILEGWSIWQGIYFAYVTGLTIGYGDLAPRQPLTQMLAIVIGFSGVLLTGLVAALAVKAFQAMPREFMTDCEARFGGRHGPSTRHGSTRWSEHRRCFAVRAFPRWSVPWSRSRSI